METISSKNEYGHFRRYSTISPIYSKYVCERGGVDPFRALPRLYENAPIYYKFAAHICIFMDSLSPPPMSPARNTSIMLNTPLYRPFKFSSLSYGLDS